MIFVSIFIIIGIKWYYANDFQTFALTENEIQAPQQQQQLTSENNVSNNGSSYKESAHFPVPNWWPNIQENVKTHFNPSVTYPSISNESFISPFAIIIGNCHVGKFVLAAPTSVCRGDE